MHKSHFYLKYCRLRGR